MKSLVIDEDHPGFVGLFLTTLRGKHPLTPVALPMTTAVFATPAFTRIYVPFYYPGITRAWRKVKPLPGDVVEIRYLRTLGIGGRNPKREYEVEIVDRMIDEENEI